MKQKKREVGYERFGLLCVAGRKVVCHLATIGNIRTQCGLYNMGLIVKQDEDSSVCKNCSKTVKILSGHGKRIAVFKTLGKVLSVVEGGACAQKRLT